MARNALPLVLAAVVVLAGCTGGAGTGGSTGANPSGGGYADAGGTATGSVGVSVGGAQDANAFRANVRNGYVPQPTDLTAAGLFHDYYFDTGQARPCEALFCPSYSRAVSADPLSGEPERYLTVGLNSGLSKADFERPRLNLVVVVDTSGSMSESFRRYYYDGEDRNTAEGSPTTTKMAAARSALGTLVSHLGPGDRLGVVAYDDRARVVSDLAPVAETDRERLRARIDGLRAGGSTDLDAGMRTATRMLEPYRNPGPGTATRVVYLTDAMPNTGDVAAGSLRDRLRRSADRRVHSTFVGVGVDFNSRLVDAISTVRGGNYYAVHSAAAFEERMDEGFAFMVTPLAFDLSLRVVGDGYRVARVYGVPSARRDGAGEDRATAGEADGTELLHAKTLFPSRTREGKTEGGVVLVRLERTGDADPTVRLAASYETPSGERREAVRRVGFGDREPGYYGSSGARKAVALSRYVDLLRNWAAYERRLARGDAPAEPPAGIEPGTLGRWEQRSVPLRVSPAYRRRIETFRSYFARERRALGADRMARELAILDRLAGTGVESARDDGGNRDGGGRDDESRDDGNRDADGDSRDRNDGSPADGDRDDGGGDDGGGDDGAPDRRPVAPRPS